MPDSVQESIAVAFSNSYGELYEPESETDVLLEEVLEKILKSFQCSHQILGQLRYVWMALIFAVVVEPTIKYYYPDSKITKKTISRLTDWILKALVKILNPHKQLDSDFENADDIDDIKLMDFQHLLSTEKISSFQVLSEALDVYSNAIKTLKTDHSLQALLNILEDCLEGYAIFPGSYGRRELFNWWLLDVVPSCWYLLAPTAVCSLTESEDADKNSILNQLEEISSLVWNLILTAIQNQSESGEKPINFHDNILLNFSNNVENYMDDNQPIITNGNKRLVGEILKI